jgi:hypothetical protein
VEPESFEDDAAIPSEQRFSPQATVERLAAEYKLSPMDLLCGLIEALAQHHVFKHRAYDPPEKAYEDVRGEIDALCRHASPARDPRREPPGSLMEAVFLLLEVERRRNDERVRAIDENPNASNAQWLDSMTMGPRADAQDALCQALAENLRQLAEDCRAGVMRPAA